MFAILPKDNCLAFGLFILNFRLIRSTLSKLKPKYKDALNIIITKLQTKKVIKVPSTESNNFLSISPNMAVGTKRNIDQIKNLTYFGFSAQFLLSKTRFNIEVKP